MNALASFLQTLQSPELPPEGDEAARHRGEEVCFRRGCDRCHEPPSFTSPRLRDVGLVDGAENRCFNPRLRGVRYRASFLHDGRARSLRDVFSVHRHPGVELSATEISDLVAFLSTL